MEEKVRVKLGSLQLQDIIQERINKLINEGIPEIVANAILENLGYVKIGKDENCYIYAKETKGYTIFLKFFSNDERFEVYDIAPRLSECLKIKDDNLKLLIEAFKVVENDLEECKSEYGKNI